MPSAYDKLVQQLGEDAARAEMARRRSLVKNLGRGGFKNKPELAKKMSEKGLKARWSKK